MFGSFFDSDKTSLAVVCAAFRCLFLQTGLRCLILLSKFKFSRVNLTFLRTIHKFVKNTDLNKTSHFRVAFLESKCNKLFLVLNS